jgi:hypothetical protein
MIGLPSSTRGRWRVPLDIEVISPAAVAARRVPVV